MITEIGLSIVAVYLNAGSFDHEREIEAGLRFPLAWAGEVTIELSARRGHSRPARKEYEADFRMRGEFGKAVR